MMISARLASPRVFRCGFPGRLDYLPRLDIESAPRRSAADLDPRRPGKVGILDTKPRGTGISLATGNQFYSGELFSGDLDSRVLGVDVYVDIVCFPSFH